MGQTLDGDSGKGAGEPGAVGREQRGPAPDQSSRAREQHARRQQEFLEKVAARTLARLQARDEQATRDAEREQPIALEDLINGTHPPLSVRWSKDRQSR